MSKSSQAVTTESVGTKQNLFAAVRWILAFMLLTAVVLKTAEYLDAPPQERLLTILFIVSHIWLAMWFLSGVMQRALVVVAVLVFAGFATYALWSGWTGRDSCGCFGTVKISPWIVLGVDIAAIIALIFLRPKGNTAKTDSSKRIAGFALAALAVSAGIAGYMFTRPAMGLSQNAQNFANKNEKADLGILERDLGFVEPKSKHSLQFTLNNPTDRPLKITKIEKECKCTNFPDSIQEIAPHSSQKIEASFDTPDLRAVYSKRIILSTDSKEIPTVVLKVHARIGLPLNITPGKLDIAKIPAGETKHFPLTLTNEGEDPVQLLYSVASSSNVTVEVPRQTLARGQSAQLLAHFTSDPTSKNFIIRVHTDSTKQAIVEVIGQ